MFNIIGLVIVGYFLYGFHKDDTLKEFENKKLKDLTINDIGSILWLVFLILILGRLLQNLF
ncbi:MAG: hypothetical protein RLZZ347_82 [Candidatus Parcubacteria bacterium]|jgi:hypothetical protein